jgi:hydrogenase/urease accessory protein HupE
LIKLVVLVVALRQKNREIRMKKHIQVAAVLMSLFLVPSVAFSHNELHTQNLFSVLLHWVRSPDHLLMFLVVIPVMVFAGIKVLIVGKFRS